MPGFLTVTTPPLTATLTTLATAKAELGVTGTADDTYITSLIARASSIVRDHCGRDLGYQLVTEVFRFGHDIGGGVTWQGGPSRGGVSDTRYRPLIFSLNPMRSLVINENSDAALTAGTDFDLNTTAGLAWRIRNGIRSWWAHPTVTAAYSAGYTLPNDSALAGVPTLPGAVEEVTLSLVRAAYTRRGRDPSVILDITEGVGRVGYAPTSSASAMTIDATLAAALQPYRIVAW